jgi:hypothetical protein
MATDFTKILKKIDTENEELREGRKTLRDAFEKLDGRINAMKAGLRVEPYDVGKNGQRLGFRRYHTGWHISTIVVGIGEIESEIPVIEAPSSIQIEIMPHVGGLLEKLSGAITVELKSTNSAVKEADRLTAAVRNV